MITYEQLKENLSYNPETGIFTWLNDSPKGGFKAGRTCNCLDVHGYIQINICRSVEKGHRLAWLYMTGEYPKKQIDHINHNRADNRWDNLREVTHRENSLNRPKQHNNKTGHVGICYDSKKKKYRAYINHEKQRIELGYYEKIDDAIEARQKANDLYGYAENHGVGYGRPKYKQYD